MNTIRIPDYVGNRAWYLSHTEKRVLTVIWQMGESLNNEPSETAKKKITQILHEETDFVYEHDVSCALFQLKKEGFIEQNGEKVHSRLDEKKEVRII